MKLRNKKTGEVFDLDKMPKWLKESIQLTAIFYSKECEVYEPAEPLIKDEKSRKVFQEWVKLYDAERFRVTHLFNSKGHITVLLSTDLTTEPSIELPGHIGKDSEIYTRIELCGEEEE